MQILQRFSVTLSSVIIVIFVCNCLYISSLKLQQISLITKFIDTYNSSNSRYFILINEDNFQNCLHDMQTYLLNLHHK